MLVWKEFSETLLQLHNFSHQHISEGRFSPLLSQRIIESHYLFITDIMNCPSRTEEPFGAGYNQNPPQLSSDLSTTADLNGLVNTRILRRISFDLSSHRELVLEPPDEKFPESLRVVQKDTGEGEASAQIVSDSVNKISRNESPATARGTCWTNIASGRRKVGNFIRNRDTPTTCRQALRQPLDGPSVTIRSRHSSAPNNKGFLQRARNVIIKYGKFVGPGFMVSVAYIDPGNYSTDVAAGASYRFKLLFVVLMSNIFAVFLQSLCIKLGTVTGLNLAENCRAHCPKWLNIFLYILAEVAVSQVSSTSADGFWLA